MAKWIIWINIIFNYMIGKIGCLVALDFFDLYKSEIDENTLPISSCNSKCLRYFLTEKSIKWQKKTKNKKK